VCDKACVTTCNNVCATRSVLRRAITCVRQGLYYDVQLRVCDKACITSSYEQLRAACCYIKVGCATRPVLRATENLLYKKGRQVTPHPALIKRSLFVTGDPSNVLFPVREI